MSKKVAIVTGAGQGIGKAIARRLAKDGMNIAIADINLETAQAAADEIAKEFGGEAMAVKCNVAQEEEVNAAVQAVLDRFGTIDVLINNAGVLSLKKPFVEYTKADWDKLFSINFMGDVFFCKAVIPTLKAKKSGRIINMSSQSAETGGMAASPVYSATKAAVWCMSKSLANELGAFGINVNAVAPGLIATEMTKNAGYRDDMVPLGRLGTPEDVADAVAFLAGNDGRYVTGMILDVNGGTVMR